VAPGQLPGGANKLVVRGFVWMTRASWKRRRRTLLKHPPTREPRELRNASYRVEVTTLGESHTTKLGLNDIAWDGGDHQPLFLILIGRAACDGSFILIDPLTTETVGAGMSRRAVDASLRRAGRVSAMSGCSQWAFPLRCSGRSAPGSGLELERDF